MNKLHSAFLVTNLLQSNIFLSLVQNLIIFAQSILMYFNVKTIKELFNDMPTQKILDFLKEIGLFNKI